MIMSVQRFWSIVGKQRPFAGEAEHTGPQTASLRHIMGPTDRAFITIPLLSSL